MKGAVLYGAPGERSVTCMFVNSDLQTSSPWPILLTDFCFSLVSFPCSSTAFSSRKYEILSPKGRHSAIQSRQKGAKYKG